MNIVNLFESTIARENGFGWLLVCLGLVLLLLALIINYSYAHKGHEKNWDDEN